LDFYDFELRAHHEHLRAAYGIRPGDAVVDVGCGTGAHHSDERGVVLDSRSWLITARIGSDHCLAS
jgi:hypothetical protein